GAADLERAGALEVLALEEDAAPARIVERRRRDDGRAVDAAGDPLGGGAYVVDRQQRIRAHRSAIIPEPARSDQPSRYTRRMRKSVIALVVLLLATGCSLISIDLTPRIKPLEERTVEGHGTAKILPTDVSGLLSEERQTPTLGTGASAPRGSSRGSGSPRRRSSRARARTWAGRSGRSPARRGSSSSP